MISAFMDMKLEQTEVYFEMTGELGLLPTEKRALTCLNEAAMIIGIEDMTLLEEVRKSNGTIWSIEDKLAEVSGYCGRIKLIAVEEGFFVHYYLQVTAYGAADADRAAVVRTRIEQIKEQEDMDCLVSMRLEGGWNRKLNETEKNKISSGFLTAIGAETIEKVLDGNLLMIYAYDPDLGDAIMLNRQQINLNLIFRDGERRTRLFAGIPAVWSDDVLVHTLDR